MKDLKEAAKELENLHKQVSKISSKVKDENIHAILDDFHRELKTNCDAAAQGNFFAISHICYFRSDLARQLIEYPLRPLYSLGYEKAEDILKWVKFYLQQKSFYFKEPTEEGKTWLKNEFPKLKADIQNILDSWWKTFKEGKDPF